MAESIEERLGTEPYAYLTTTGRRSGERREIEIWFAARGDTIYLLNGGGSKPAGASDWVRNLRALPEAAVRIGGERFTAVARFIAGTGAEDRLARDLLFAKYQPGNSGDLAGWRETGYPVALELRRT
ncbi:MAG: nitroreductase family deazaflavin-dependent oxidoreductase [Dehalococcoidia bacterium]|nr:nitroreductase family deazaflavin-dependent oxidoreductase [Dehalococcoidia bacterium]